MLKRLGRAARRAGRGIAALQLRLMGELDRAEVLEGALGHAVVEVPVGAASLKFFAPAPLLVNRARGLLTKEPDTIRWIDAMAADAVFWDIGANVGVYSLYAAARTRCRVVAFEPSAFNYVALARNVQLNALEDSVAALCVALGAQTRLGLMNLPSPAMGMAMAQFGGRGETSPYWHGGAHVSHATLGFSVDDFVARLQPPFPTHMKIDVDGLELAILQGARETLRDARLASVLVELSITDEAERARALELLAEAGFALTAQGATQGEGPELAANHLFERRR